MRQAGHPVSRLGYFGKIQINESHPRLNARIGQNLPPRGNSQRMAKGAPTFAFGFAVKPGLGWGQHKTSGFNRPRPQKHLPMSRTRDVIERGGNREDLGASLSKPAEKMWKSKIIANGHANLGKACIGQHGLRTGPIG